MGLLVWPCVVRKWGTFPFVPGQCHVTACLGVFGACGDHRFVRDG